MFLNVSLKFFSSSTNFWTPCYKVVNTTITNALNLIAAFSHTSILNLQVGYVGIADRVGGGGPMNWRRNFHDLKVKIKMSY